MTVPEAFQIAFGHHQAGRLVEAEAIYRQILSAQPNHSESWHMLGLIALHAGRHDLAVEWMRHATVLDPTHSIAHSNLGEAYCRMKRFGDAVAMLQRALQIDPAFHVAQNNLGNALTGLGRFEEAFAAYRQALAGKPDYANAYYNFGIALAANHQFDDAVVQYRRAIQLKPDHADAFNNLGIALAQRGKFDEAVASYRRALELKPDYADACGNLGNAMVEQGRVVEAIDVYRRAIQLKQGYAEAHCNLGTALKRQGLLPEAIAEYRRALEIKPDFAAAHSNLGDALKDDGQLEEMMESHRKAVALKAEDPLLHSNLLYSALFDPAYDAQALRELGAAWEAQHGEPRWKSIRPHTNQVDSDRRLKLGYVSPNFSRHVIHQFLLPLLEAHDHTHFEIYCYASVKVPDAITQRMMKSADVWRDVLGFSAEVLAERIREDGIDILVDLAQHMADNLLPVLALRPAPVQVAWLGYPGSTGLRAIDYRLTDASMEPEGAPWSESVEQVVRLPDSWFCFDPVEEYPAPSELPALKAGHVTFGCLNAFYKVNDPVLERWAAVLRAVEGARLLLRCPRGTAQPRVREFFSARGIAEERLELHDWVPTREEFLQLYHRIDLALDPFPYNGGTTTCEALWMGVPVLTLPGEGIVARIGLSILMACGVPEFVASSEAGYVQLAVNLAGDLPRLAQLRSTLRERMKSSAFMDGRRFARNFEAACRQMWESWCAPLHSAPRA